LAQAVPDQGVTWVDGLVSPRVVHSEGMTRPRES
jgi:hypothetical protein